MSTENHPGPNYYLLTHQFLSGHQWDRALATSLEWLGRDPENHRAHRAAAQSLINLDRKPEALAHLKKVLAGNPKDDFAYRLLSIVHFDQKQYPAADQAIQQALALNPHDAYHWHHLAWMTYNHGDRVAAQKWAAKALELRPEDPDFLNLVILCEPEGAGGAAQKIQRFEAALAHDPENSNLHNNIGVQYLNKLKDYAKAEESFRRGLFFDPSSKLLRRNLFITVKHRDRFYRILCAPKDFLLKLLSLFYGLRKKNIVLYLLLIPVWLLTIRFVLGGLLLWAMFIWPLTKVYEYLTIGDLLYRAGEIGARRGGFLGYRKWPVKLRLSLFALFLVSFWGGIAFIIWQGTDISSDNVSVIGGTLLLIGVAIFIAYWVRLRLRSRIRRMGAQRRSRRIEAMLAPGGRPKKKWWSFLRPKIGSK